MLFTKYDIDRVRETIERSGTDSDAFAIALSAAVIRTVSHSADDWFMRFCYEADVTSCDVEMALERLSAATEGERHER